MTASQIFASLITSVAYVGLIALCIMTFHYMRELQRKFDSLHDQQRFLTNMGEVAAKTYALVAAMSLEAEVDKLNDMERQKRSLVEGEHFEQAGQLQQLIERQQRKIARAMETMRQTFGDKIEVSMEYIKSSDE